MTKLLLVIGAFALIVALIVFGPLAILWSLNTLFPVLAIPYNFYTWLATVVMNVTWMGKVSFKKD